MGKAGRSGKPRYLYPTGRIGALVWLKASTYESYRRIANAAHHYADAHGMKFRCRRDPQSIQIVRIA